MELGEFGPPELVAIHPARFAAGFRGCKEPLKPLLLRKVREASEGKTMVLSFCKESVRKTKQRKNFRTMLEHQPPGLGPTEDSKPRNPPHQLLGMTLRVPFATWPAGGGSSRHRLLKETLGGG